MYQPGAIGFTVAGGVPKVGQLQNAAWTLSDTCTFKLITSQTGTQPNDTRRETGPSTSGLSVQSSTTSNKSKENTDRLDMPPPPSPASSTCSDTGSITNSHKRQKRMAPSSDAPTETKRDEEEWPLRDVIFVEDVRSVPAGRVLKVDGAYAAVRFPTTSGGNRDHRDRDTDDTVSLLQDCRLMRKDDLQVIKSSSTSRVPDCFQRTPRRVNIPEGTGQILTIAVDGQGIHAIVRSGTKLSYVLYNISSGRAEQDNPFPSDTASFMGLYPQHISLTSAGECSESILILRDGNSTIYPLAKDCAEAVRDPQWLDLPPVRCVSAGTLALSVTSQNMKNQVALIVMALEQQLLMPRILRCDLDGVRQVLVQLESETSKCYN